MSTGNLKVPGGGDPSMEEILASIRRILNEDEAAQATPPAASPGAADASPAAPPAPPLKAKAAREDVLVLDESMMVAAPVTVETTAPAEPVAPDTISPPHAAEPPSPPDEPAALEAAPEPVHEAVASAAEEHPKTVETPTEPAPAAEARPPDTVPLPVMHMFVAPPPGADFAPKQEVPTNDTITAPASSGSATTELVAPEAAAAAASSLGSLVRTLSTGRPTPVYASGPTLEDMVRGELRTVLKPWLDTQLPSVVDQLVRAELRPLLKAWLDLNLPPLVELLVRTEIEKVIGQAAAPTA